MTEPNPVRGFFAAMLIGVGLLMMILCGGCGALFFAGFLIGSMTSSNHEDLVMLILPLLLGGLPALVGFGLFAGGRSLGKKPPAGPA